MIPQILHRIWLGSPVPDWAVEIYESWRDAYPDWVHCLWTDETLPDLKNEMLYDRASSVVAHATSGSVWQLRSDIARYEILNRYGGLYVDCDLELLKPLTDEMLRSDLLIAWEIQGQALGNTILGSCSDHPFLREVIDGMVLSASVSSMRAPTIISGPRYITKVWHQMRPDFAVQRQELFYPYGHSEAHKHPRTGDERTLYPNAHTCHYWMNARSKKGVSL